MNDQAAQAEAERRWGVTGQAYQLDTNDFLVCDSLGTEPGSAGRGTTWESAFADADNRKVQG